MTEKEKDGIEDREGCGWRKSVTSDMEPTAQKPTTPETPPVNMTGWEHPELKD